MAPWSKSRVGSQQQQQQSLGGAQSSSSQHGNLNRSADANAHLHPPTAATGVASNNGGRSGRYRSSSRVSQGGLEPLDNLQQYEFQHLEIDSSSSDEGLKVPRPRHTRSMSHPFPSLFSSKKKKPGPMNRADDDSESDSGGAAGPPPNMRGKLPPNRGHRNGSSTGSRDFVAGNCMTCASLVRWPRELHVFKCTICLTINDLQPIGRDRDQGRDHDAARYEDAQRLGVFPEGRRSGWSYDKPVSLENTKSIISQCLTTFVESALKKYTTAEEPVDYPGSSTNSFFDNSTLNKSCFDVGNNNNNILQPVHIATTPRYNDYSSSSRPLPVPGGAGDRVQHRRNPSWANVIPKPISTSYPDKRPIPKFSFPLGSQHQQRSPPPSPGEDAKRIFRPLEDYIVSCFTSFYSLNNSFTTRRGHHHSQSHSQPAAVEEQRRRPSASQGIRKDAQAASSNHTIPDLDPKLLLLGDFAENGSWWTGCQEEVVPMRSTSSKSQTGPPTVGPRSPRIEWLELEEWYTAVIDAAKSWPDVYSGLVDEDPALAVTTDVLKEIETKLLIAQEHTQRTLLKACETILKRPGRLMVSPHDLRFLLIVAANPLLHGGHRPYSGEFDHPDGAVTTQSSNGPNRSSGPASGRHSGIIKRIVGLMSNSSPECQNHLGNWFARYPESWFVKTKDLVAEFLAYRLNRQNEKKYEAKIDITGGLIPSMGAGRSPASLHAALGHTPGASKKQKEIPKKIIYQEDWQIKAAARVLGLLFSANNMGHLRRSRPDDSSLGDQDRVRARGGQILPTTDFYITLLDDSDLVADFEVWERKQQGANRFSFCQYPFLLSIGAKIRILEHDARRQMENKARDAFFDSIMSHRIINQFLVLNVRRDCLVEDSLKGVSEAIGAGGEDLKKGLKIQFKGEEGVDMGGVKKEWFLLLVREVFGRDHGMFIYDDDSQYCYFNPYSLEPSEQYFLVGVVFGLAIYNSTILDVALPPFVFRKLLMAGMGGSGKSSHNGGGGIGPVIGGGGGGGGGDVLEDLAEYRPRLAKGLRQLLEYDENVEGNGSVEDVFCLDFVVEVDRYGAVERIPLCPGGERRPVTRDNRREYVDLYVRYLLDVAVARQFEPFKRGFFTVCGGNALSLFRAEEIELLVVGEANKEGGLDVEGLKAVAEYEGFDPKLRGDEEIKEWFWQIFEGAEPKDQRRLLGFITGSDRIPAMGAASLVVKVSLLGDDIGRYPTARTCFNTFSLWRYGSKEMLERMLWGAVGGSEGFGLK